MSSIPPPHLPPLSALQYAPRPEIQQPTRRTDFTTTLPPLRSLDRSIENHAREDQAALVSDEHERTRQERLKLERAKVKRDMLRELLQAGVHPSQIPAFFAEHEAATSPTSSPVEAPNYTTQRHAGSSPGSSTWNGSPSLAPPSSAARTPIYAPVQANLPFGISMNTSPPQQHQSNHLRSQYTATPPQQHPPSHLRSQSTHAPAIQVQPASLSPQSTHPPTAHPQLTPAPSQISFVADRLPTSPRALQFKFYKPGPRQKVQRRRRKNSTATTSGSANGDITARSPQNGIRKDTSRRLSVSRARRTSAAGSSPGGASPGSQHDVIMSDADEDSDGDEHESGSEEG